MYCFNLVHNYHICVVHLQLSSTLFQKKINGLYIQTDFYIYKPKSRSDIDICILRLTYNIRRNYFLSFDALFDPEKILYRLHYMVSAKRFTMFNRQKGYNPIKINFSHYCINFCSKNQNTGNLNRKFILFKHQSVKGWQMYLSFRTGNLDYICS